MKLTRRQLKKIIIEHMTINENIGDMFKIGFDSGRPIVKNWIKWGPVHLYSVVGKEPIEQLMKIKKTYWKDRNNDDVIDDEDLPHEIESYDSATKSEVESAIDAMFAAYGPTDDHKPALDIAEDIKASVKSLPTVMKFIKPFMSENPILPNAETFGFVFKALQERGVDEDAIKQLRDGIIQLIEMVKSEFPKSILSKTIESPENYIPSIT